VGGMAFKVTKWLPEDAALLAAIGRVAVLHGQLDYCLRMTVKSLEGVSVGKALRDTEGKGPGELSTKIRKVAGGDGDVPEPLREILNRARLATDRRNKLLHGFWCKRLDGTPGIRTEHGTKPRSVEFGPIPTIAELEDLANELDQVEGELNSARSEGFLKDALAP
jgi:hypothetical protein